MFVIHHNTMQYPLLFVIVVFMVCSRCWLGLRHRSSSCPPWYNTMQYHLLFVIHHNTIQYHLLFVIIVSMVCCRCWLGLWHRSSSGPPRGSHGWHGRLDENHQRRPLSPRTARQWRYGRILYLFHSHSYQGVWASFVPLRIPNFLKENSWNVNLKYIIRWFHLHIIPMTLYKDNMPCFYKFIHIYGWNLSILWPPLKIHHTPKRWPVSSRVAWQWRYSRLLY